MKLAEVGLCLPLLVEGDLLGIIFLGGKKSGDPYSREDIDLLTTLANQASIALENARLYDQVQDLSQNLQKKVDEQTKELKTAYEVEKKARQELEKLDATKNQFLLTTQHHLRTPLTTMKWTAGALLKTKLNKKAKEGMESIKLSTGKLIDMVNEFLDITQFQLGKNAISLKTNVKIQPILEEIISELKTEINAKKLYLRLEPDNQEEYEIIADPGKLKAALFNIIDNAVKYTIKGGVVIEISKKDNKLMVLVKDTGIGIPPENLNNLFDRVFERGQVAQKTFVTGRGIGLYLASQIIKAHNGKIWAESLGEGKGSTFYIEFPMK
jgi:signal transduction histidine kinase